MFVKYLAMENKDSTIKD